VGPLLKQRIILDQTVILYHLATLFWRRRLPVLVSLGDASRYDIAVRCFPYVQLDFSVDALEDIARESENA
jgi:hypothetical protein